MKRAARDPPDRKVDIAADQTREQRQEGQLGRQSDQLKGVVDYADFDQDEKKRRDEKEYNRVDNDERPEEYPADSSTAAPAAPVPQSMKKTVRLLLRGTPQVRLRRGSC